MAGEILDKAIRDFRKFSQSDFSKEITFVASGTIVRGLISRHHLSIDPSTGIPVSSVNAHINISEKVLTDAGITTRNAEKKFVMKGQKVSWKDSEGTQYTYLIDEVFPSQTLGMIVMTLGSWH